MLVAVFCVALSGPSAAGRRKHRKSTTSRDLRRHHRGRLPSYPAPSRTLEPHVMDPAAAQNLWETGMSQITHGGFERASGSFAQLAEAGYEDVATLGQGLVYMHSMRYAEAVEAFSDPVLAGTAQHQMALRYKGNTLHKMNYWAEAVEALRQALTVPHSQGAVVRDIYSDLCLTLTDDLKFYIDSDGAKNVRPGCNGQVCPEESVAKGEETLEACRVAASLADQNHTLQYMHESVAKILIHLNRRVEAVSELAIALSLIPGHTDIAAQIHTLRASSTRTTGLAISKLNTGVLHTLWPCKDSSNDVETIEDAPQMFPFKFVSSEPGSIPSARPWLTPLWLVEDSNSVIKQSSLNIELAKIIRSIMSDQATTSKSNIGGYQSPEPQDFLVNKATLQGKAGEAVRTLHLHILEQISDFADAVRPVATPFLDVA